MPLSTLPPRPEALEEVLLSVFLCCPQRETQEVTTMTKKQTNKQTNKEKACEPLCNL